MYLSAAYVEYILLSRSWNRRRHMFLLIISTTRGKWLVNKFACVAHAFGSHNFQEENQKTTSFINHYSSNNCGWRKAVLKVVLSFLKWRKWRDVQVQYFLWTLSYPADFFKRHAKKNSQVLLTREFIFNHLFLWRLPRSDRENSVNIARIHSWALIAPKREQIALCHLITPCGAT